ncbi:hypothetical protein Hanom_Chr14g01321891 [Helianthus anomalus]
MGVNVMEGGRRRNILNLHNCDTQRIRIGDEDACFAKYWKVNVLTFGNGLCNVVSGASSVVYASGFVNSRSGFNIH